MNQEKEIKDILEIVTFMKDNMASKDDLNNLRTELKKEMQDVKEELRGEIDNAKEELRGEIDSAKEELRGEIQDVRNEMINHVDKFIGLYKTQESENSALAWRMERLENKAKKAVKQKS